MSRTPWLQAALLMVPFLPLAADGAAAQVPVFEDGFASGSDCAWSLALPSTAQAIGLGSTAGDTTDGSDGIDLSCQAGGAREKVYRFDAPVSALLNLSLMPQNAVNLGVAVRTSCAAADEVLCVDGNFAGGSEFGQVGIALGESYYLIVDGFFVGEQGPFLLELSICGDGVIQPPEVCDGVDLGGHSCLDLGFVGGDLLCQANCLAFDVSACIPI